ncbi:Rieske 2Fe-2S domain-containing protein [Nocardioides sp. NPDC047086]|uniref:cytochrome bc1 complex Rieske iron-sulfur subunit n=1 Tax=Nocardioides sp. NPDC047086 TaxID=3154810 RepID=UPI0033C7CBEC
MSSDLSEIEKHDDSHPELNAHTDALLPDPGMHEHHWRPTDVDPKAEKRAERQVSLFFGLSAICSVLFVVAYFVVEPGYDGDVWLGFGASNLALGASLGFALLFLGIGVIQWARKLVIDIEHTEDRHPAASSPATREAAVAELKAALHESGMARRPFIRNAMIGSAALLGLPAIVMLRDLGETNAQITEEQPYPGAGLEHTVWDAGVRVVRDVVGTPIRPGDLEIGDLVNAEPATIFDGSLHGAPLQIAKSKAATILLRMDPNDIDNDVTRNWSVDGIVAYSKICTHVGCPISLNERTTHHLLCPCHQSTFDLADHGKVIFGPAGRHLPQLPLGVDADGFLVALSDYPEPVGVSYWERNTYDIDEIFDDWSKDHAADAEQYGYKEGGQ